MSTRLGEVHRLNSIVRENGLEPIVLGIRPDPGIRATAPRKVSLGLGWAIKMSDFADGIQLTGCMADYARTKS